MANSFTRAAIENAFDIMARKGVVGPAVMSPDREAQLRSYAAGETSWAALKAIGQSNHLDVPGGLHELGLRPPLAPFDLQPPGLKVLREVLGLSPQAPAVPEE